MKVLLAHNFYRSSSPSGEDAVYRNEVELLRSRGVSVMQYERHNDEISGAPGRISTAVNSVWSKKTYQEVSSLIRQERPDIAHFHNIWYLISPSAYSACRDAGVPVVQSLHNFRMFCASGLLMRDGRVCEECVGRLPWRGAVYGCFRNSRLYSAPVAASEIIHKAKKTWLDTVDSYIALTEFGKHKFMQCGLPENKIFVKPNFLKVPPDLAFSNQNYSVFIGRLSGEKGVHILIDALKALRAFNSFSLNIVGDGPAKADIAGNIETEKLDLAKLVGRKDHDACMEMLSGARFLVLPSVCYENFPMTIVEAFACGKPVIASNLGAMSSIVKHMKTGLLFEPGNSKDLAEKIIWMINNDKECLAMGRNARAEFDNKYTPERNFEMLMNIYNQAIAGNKR